MSGECSKRDQLWVRRWAVSYRNVITCG